MTTTRSSAPSDGTTDPAGVVAGGPAAALGAIRAPGIARRLLRKPVTLAAVLVLLVVSLAVAAAPLLAGSPPLQQDLLHILATPSAAHPLGTDTLGRDVLSRLLVGGRTTLLGLVQAVTVLLLIGVPVGVAAGYAGGIVDSAVMRITDLVYSVPTFIIILVVLTVFTDSETAAMVTLGVLGSPGLIRVLRGNTRVIRQELYVRAARSTGLTELQLVRRHVLPRLAGPIIVQASLFAATAILVETGLGFLGFGVQPPSPSWGNMVAEAAQSAQRQPWLLVPSGGLIALVILALGLVGDGLRDATAERWAGAPIGRRPAARGSTARRAPSRPAPALGRAAPPSPGADGPDDLLLSVRDLSVTFPVSGRDTTVVRGVSFDIRRGQTVGIVGESGSGKTVTALALLGLLRGGGRVSGGQALFEGQDLLGLGARQLRTVRGRGIGLISQDPVAGLDPAYTVGAQLSEVVAQHDGGGRTAVRARMLELLDLVRLPEPDQIAHRHPHQLSGGMAQRVGIALALAGRPRLLIADEPTTALDVTVQAEVLDLLMELRERTGTSIVLVTHDWGVVAESCDRALVMYAGEVVEDAGVLDLFRHARHPYTAGLLAANPSRTRPGHRLPAIPGIVPPPISWPSGCHFADRCPLAERACTDAPIPLFAPQPEHLTRCRRHEQLAGSPEIAVPR